VSEGKKTVKRDGENVKEVSLGSIGSTALGFHKALKESHKKHD
jgi:hypothetical protein